MPNRKFHIRCDMEGVSGVVSMAQVTPNTPEYLLARAWFMEEIRALIDGLIRGGATDVSIYDEHWFGRNVDVAQIPRGVRVFCGKPPYRADWAGGLDSSHHGLILHGFHSMDGSGQTLCHTYEPDFRSIRLNGISVGEIGVETAIAGDWGVPLVLVIADSAGCEEARQLVPGVAEVATKISQSQFGAECFALADTLESIRDQAVRIAENLPPTVPTRMGRDIEMICEFKPGAYLDGLRRKAGKQFINDDQIRLMGSSVTAVWAEYWQLKLSVQADIG
jgi:D-amino peptidase